MFYLQVFVELDTTSFFSRQQTRASNTWVCLFTLIFYKSKHSVHDSQFSYNRIHYLSLLLKIKITCCSFFSRQEDTQRKSKDLSTWYFFRLRVLSVRSWIAQLSCTGQALEKATYPRWDSMFCSEWYKFFWYLFLGFSPAEERIKFPRKMAEKFEALEQQLEMFIENTRQLGIIVGDVQPNRPNVLNQKMLVALTENLHSRQYLVSTYLGLVRHLQLQLFWDIRHTHGDVAPSFCSLWGVVR